MMQKKIVILNGPKSSGKDMAAKWLEQWRMDTQHFEFKSQLYMDVANYYGISMAQLNRLYEGDKSAPQECFGGKSMREAMIYVSEEVVKPEQGLEHYGRILADQIENSICDVAVISDGGVANDNGGFYEWNELFPLHDAFDFDNILIVQLYRQGCSFEGDSRRYWGEPTFPCVVLGTDEMDITHPNDTPIISPNAPDLNVIRVFNNGTEQEYFQAINSIVGKWKRNDGGELV